MFLSNLLSSSSSSSPLAVEHVNTFSSQNWSYVALTLYFYLSFFDIVSYHKRFFIARRHQLVAFSLIFICLCTIFLSYTVIPRYLNSFACSNSLFYTLKLDLTSDLFVSSLRIMCSQHLQLDIYFYMPSLVTSVRHKTKTNIS